MLKKQSLPYNPFQITHPKCGRSKSSVLFIPDYSSDMREKQSLHLIHPVSLIQNAGKANFLLLFIPDYYLTYWESKSFHIIYSRLLIRYAKEANPRIVFVPNYYPICCKSKSLHIIYSGLFIQNAEGSKFRLLIHFQTTHSLCAERRIFMMMTWNYPVHQKMSRKEKKPNN